MTLNNITNILKKTFIPSTIKEFLTLDNEEKEIRKQLLNNLEKNNTISSADESISNFLNSINEKTELKND